MNLNSPERYALSFTSGGLLIREAQLLLAEYFKLRDWVKVRQSSLEKNLIQARTQSSSQRVTREVIQRLACFDENELQLLSDVSPTERRYLMWAGTCRRYLLIGEFAEEVLREKFLLLTPSLGSDDFDKFITGKSLWHAELEELKPSTLSKLRQNLFRMLHEAELVNKEGVIVQALLSERVQEALSARNPSDIRFFPTNISVEVSGR